jgi:hypothetical protein
VGQLVTSGNVNDRPLDKHATSASRFWLNERPAAIGQARMVDQGAHHRQDLGCSSFSKYIRKRNQDAARQRIVGGNMRNGTFPLQQSKQFLRAHQMQRVVQRCHEFCRDFMGGRTKKLLKYLLLHSMPQTYQSKHWQEHARTKREVPLVAKFFTNRREATQVPMGVTTHERY